MCLCINSRSQNQYHSNYKSINNIKELLEICDIMHVYDNTETPKRITRKHKDDLSIYPNEYWSEQAILELFG